MEFINNLGMFPSKDIQYFYLKKSKDEFLVQIDNSFKDYGISIEAIELRTGWNDTLDIIYEFSAFPDKNPLQIYFKFGISVTRMGSAFRSPGERYLKGSLMFGSKIGSKTNNQIMNAIYNKLDTSALYLFEGIEDKPEEEQVNKMIKESKILINEFINYVDKNLTEIVSSDIAELMPEIKEIFIF